RLGHSRGQPLATDLPWRRTELETLERHERGEPERGFDTGYDTRSDMRSTPRRSGTGCRGVGGMNAAWSDQVVRRAGERARYIARRLSVGVCTTFGRDAPISRVHVINLDREAGRYDLLKKELHRVRCRSGSRLTELTRRFAAVD